MSTTVLGIRHHGPGSARSVCEALRTHQPDVILIEGPPDANDLIPLAADKDMRPPVALLVYVPNEPKRAVFYPFAEFSPEWQAMQYGLAQQVPVRFIDLPQANQFGLDHDDEKASDDSEIRQDPLRWVAEAAGYSDSERWWDQMIEQRKDSTEIFNAIMELMSALRQEVGQEEKSSAREVLREAYMRQSIRAAEREGFQRVVVVCGAWHGPELQSMPPVKDDTALLKGLPKTKVSATWIPWTMSRLTYWSGYGAGVESPGYYQHLWTVKEDVTVRWMIRVAQLLREEDLDASSASVIEAVRLSHSLAALRGRPVAGLPEFNDAARAVLCFGNDTPMRLIGEKLIVGELLGQVPESTPSLPLHQDLQREQKRLRLPAEASQQLKDFDLRKANDLDRSHLLHRLNLLDINWGTVERATGKGTFHEVWRLQWRPEFAVSLIEANVWGNTVLAAAAAYSCAEADRTQELPLLTSLVERALLADLPEAITHIMTRLQEVSALSNDIPHAMDALPSLVAVLRYGNVRQTDTAMVKEVVDGLVIRIVIGLPNACSAHLASAGGAGAITPDLTPDEAAEWLAVSDAHELDRIFLVSPSSSDERLASTVAACRGWVYATSVMGVTGARAQSSSAAPELVRRVRATDPQARVGVGLGVSNGVQAAEVTAYADAVIVGSALVATLLEAEERGAPDDLSGLRAVVADLAAGVRRNPADRPGDRGTSTTTVGLVGT